MDYYNASSVDVLRYYCSILRACSCYV